MIPIFGLCQENRVREIDSLLIKANKIGIFNGNVLVAQNQKIILEKSYGYFDFKKAKLLDLSSSMPIGSISKEFNGVGILYLSEKGKINIEDNVSKYIANLPNWANEVKISNLIQYTSGLPRMNHTTDEEWFQKLKEIEKLEFGPGKGYLYSNANVFLQKKIIEKVTNQDYHHFLKKYLFKKAKVTSELLQDSLLTETMAHSFDNDYNETSFIHSANGIYFTIKDLYKWTKALYKGKIVSYRALKTLSKSFDDNSQSSLGFFKIMNNAIDSHYHDGSGNNYESLVKHDGENNLTIILMCNNQNFKLGNLAESIENIMTNNPYSLPKKSIYLDIRGKLLDDFKNGMEFYHEIKSNGKDIYDFNEEVYDLYSTARYLMRRKQYSKAVEILHLSTILDLQNKGGVSYAYTLIAECYGKIENIGLAKIYLEKAIELDKANKNAQEMLNGLNK